MKTLGEIPKKHSKLTPDKEALVFKETRLSYREFNERITRLANWMLDLGVNRGDTITALAENSHRYYELYYAAFKIGLTVVPVNYRLGQQEMTFVINNSEAKVFCVGAPFLDYVQKSRSEFKFVETLVSFDGPHPGMEEYERILKESGNEEPDVFVDEDDVAVVSFTGGTSGVMKGAMITHRNFLSILPTVAIYGGFDWNIKTLQVLSPFHLTIWQTLLAHYLGGTSVLLDKVEIEEIAEVLEAEKITHINLVPTLINWLLQVPGIEKRDFSALACISYGGSPIAESTLKKAIEVLTPNMIGGYGMTETTGVASILPREYHQNQLGETDLRRLKSAGKEAYHNELKIVDDEGREVPPGVIGEIIIRGPNVQKGYFKMPELTAERMKEGWMYSNDLGYLDEENFLHIVDRKSDMIITGGENVYPAEVENVMSMHPAVFEVAVVSAPDERWGEAVVACVVLKENQHPCEEELLSFCRERLAGYKCPRIVKFVPELPKSAGLKIQRAEAKKWFWKGRDKYVA